MPSTRVNIENVLCPTDYSEFSARALERAVRLAQWFEARLTALHVIPSTSPAVMLAGAAGGGYVAVPENLLREVRESAEEELRRFVRPHLGAGIAIDTVVVEGEPGREIERVAGDLPADLVVMGTHGRSGWAHLWLGSTTETVMRRTPCPVLAVGRENPGTLGGLFHRILCAVDLTPASQGTVDLALSFAQENLARVTLLHVAEGRAAANGVDAALEQLRRSGRPARPFCDVTERVETGSAAREIVRVAKETRADLVVVGAHSAFGLVPFFLGSTAAEVVRHAPCPVLVSREMKDAEAPREGARQRPRDEASAGATV